jgi:tetratricopeptide (TPR) repeat protein
MSIILDALRKGRGRQTTRVASSAAQTDAVLQTLGYARVNQVSRFKRVMRIAAALALGVLAGILLWITVVWVARAYLQQTAVDDGTAVPTEQSRAAPVVPPKGPDVPASTLTRTSLTAGGRVAATPEAIRNFQRAISIDPHDAHARNNLGVAYLEEGKVDEAAAQFHAALQIDAHTAEAHYNLAVLEDEAGNAELAQRHYHEFLQYGADAYPSVAIEVRRRLDSRF